MWNDKVCPKCKRDCTSLICGVCINCFTTKDKEDDMGTIKEEREKYIENKKFKPGDLVLTKVSCKLGQIIHVIPDREYRHLDGSIRTNTLVRNITPPYVVRLEDHSMCNFYGFELDPVQPDEDFDSLEWLKEDINNPEPIEEESPFDDELINDFINSNHKAYVYRGKPIIARFKREDIRKGAP